MIYLLRHGETLWNKVGRLQGQRDSPLTLRGVAQAKSSGRRLRERIGDAAGWTILSSPLGRCWQTAVLVAEGLGLDPDDIRFEPRLMEIAYGIWEGLRYEDIEVEYRRLWQARQADRWSFTVPGGESYATLSKRALTWLDEVDPAARLIVVSHGGTGRVLRGYCDGLLPTQTVALAADHEAIHILAPKAARAGGAGSP